MSNPKFHENQRQKKSCHRRVPFEFFKKLRLGKSEKHQRVPPLEKKNFVSDFDETQDFKSLWPRDFTHEI